MTRNFFYKTREYAGIFLYQAGPGVPCMTGDSNWDIIVIGGGLAGLTSAAYLAMAGKSVLLLEQQDRPGGCCGAHSTGGRQPRRLPT